jgi:hypothetical protein
MGRPLAGKARLVSAGSKKLEWIGIPATTVFLANEIEHEDVADTVHITHYARNPDGSRDVVAVVAMTKAAHNRMLAQLLPQALAIAREEHFYYCARH